MPKHTFYNHEEHDGSDEFDRFFDRNEIPTFIMIGTFLGFVIGFITATLVIGG